MVGETFTLSNDLAQTFSGKTFAIKRQLHRMIFYMSQQNSKFYITVSVAWWRSIPLNKGNGKIGLNDVALIGKVAVSACMSLKFLRWCKQYKINQASKVGLFGEIIHHADYTVNRCTISGSTLPSWSGTQYSNTLI